MLGSWSFIFLTTYLSCCITIQSFFTIILMHSFWKKNKDSFENLNKKKNKWKSLLYMKNRKPPKEDQKKRALRRIICFPCHYWEAAENTNEERKKNVLELRKSEKDHGLLKELMSLTFPVRRWKVLTQNMRVWTIFQTFLLSQEMSYSFVILN